MKSLASSLKVPVKEIAPKTQMNAENGIPSDYEEEEGSRPLR